MSLPAPCVYYFNSNTVKINLIIKAYWSSGLTCKYFSFFFVFHSQASMSVFVTIVRCLLSLVPSGSPFWFALCIPYSFHLLFTLPATPALSSQITGSSGDRHRWELSTSQFRKMFCASLCCVRMPVSVIVRVRENRCVHAYVWVSIFIWVCDCVTDIEWYLSKHCLR